MRLERLAGQDLVALTVDDLGWPEDIGAIAILDGTGCKTAAGASASRTYERPSPVGSTWSPDSVRTCTALSGVWPVHCG